MNRGDPQERIFVDDPDREQFLATLEEACQKTDWQLHSLCLMSNHFHLVLETPTPNLVEGMKWFLGVYTRRFNLRYKIFGHLFSGRYKALIVDGSGTGYLKTACDYAHLNPVRAQLLAPEQPLQSYRWSSYPWYVGPVSARPAWLRVDRLLGEWGIPWDGPQACVQFAAAMEARRQGELEQEFVPVQRGWCLGSEPFRAAMRRYIQEHRGQWHYAAELHESTQAKAEELIGRALQSAGLAQEQLAAWRKGHPFKLQLAARLRSETTVSIEWIAQHLHMGTRPHLARLLQERKKTRDQPCNQSQPWLNI